MGQEFVLIACVVLGVILVPSLITVRSGYYPSEPDHGGPSPAFDSQPTE